MKKLNRILSKKGWTGEEVGKALIASVIHDFVKEDPEDRLFTQENFDNMVKSLTDPADIQVYNVFLSIRNCIIASYNMTQGYFQQLCNGFYRYNMFLQGALHADKALQKLEKVPYIMGQKQYDTALAEAEDMLRAKVVSFGILTIDTIHHFIDIYQEGKAKEIPAALRKALDAANKEKLTSPRMLEAAVGNIYYGFGELRSDNYRYRSEFSAAVSEERARQMAKDYEASPEEIDLVVKRFRLTWDAQALFFEGTEGLKKRYKAARGHAYKGDPKDLPRAVELALEYFVNVEDEMEPERYFDIVDALGLEGLEIVRAYTPEEKKEAIKKLQEQELTLLEYLQEYSVSVYAGLETAEGLRAFKADFPELFKATEAYLKEQIPQASKLKPTQYQKLFITYGELVDMGFKPYEGVTLPNNEAISELYEAEGRGSYSDRQRISRKGIAIWQEHEEAEDFSPSSIMQNPYELEFLNADKQIREEMSTLNSVFIEPALRFLYRANLLFDVLAKTYGIEGMDALKFDSSITERQIKAFNGLIYDFYYRAYGDQEEKEQKRALIKKLFKPIDVEALKPTEDQRKVQEQLFFRAGYTMRARELLADPNAIIVDFEELEKAARW